MPKKTIIGVGGVAGAVRKMYFGVGGVARAVKMMYLGVGGLAKAASESHVYPVGTAWSWKNTGTTEVSYSFTVLESGYYTIQVHGGGGGGGYAGSPGYAPEGFPWSDGWGGGGIEYTGKVTGGGGGGSGNRWVNVWLTKGYAVTIIVGVGGTGATVSSSRGSQGGSSSFAISGGATYSCAGGIGGIMSPSSSDLGGGAAQGNIASSGGRGMPFYGAATVAGGTGGDGGTSETYSISYNDGWGNSTTAFYMMGKGGYGGNWTYTPSGYGQPESSLNNPGTKGNNGGVFLTLTSY